MSKRRKVFFFGPLPPPTHGMAVVNAQMVSLLARYAEVIVADTSPGALARGLSYHFRKALRVMSACLRIPLAGLGGCRTLYGSPDDGWGGMWTIALLAAGRLAGMNVTLHHHSYRYLAVPSSLMRVITAIAGKAARHVVLGDDMGRRLAALYPAAQNVIMCENSVRIAVEQRESARGGFTIGMLANLTVEKGALEFLDAAKAMTDAGLPVRFILAGPVADPAVAAAIGTCDDRVSAIGAVHGEAKEAFFADIDLFLFPTRYKTEAFPLVLMESLTRGVPVLAYRRGGIGALQCQNGVELVDPEGNFVAAAVALVRKHIGAEKPDRPAIAGAARERNAANLARLERLAAEICGVQGQSA